MPGAQTERDPAPSPRLLMIWRLGRIVRWLGLLSVVIAVLALAAAIRDARSGMLIASALGMALFALLGTALLTFSLMGRGKHARMDTKDSEK